MKTETNTITNKNHILFIRQNDKPCYAWEYCLNILKNNPIREGEQEYFKGLKEMRDSTKEKIGWLGISKEIWTYAWDLYFKENKSIMVYFSNQIYYINKDLKIVV